MTRVIACHQRTSGWCADRASRVVIGEPHSFFGHPVEMRSCEFPLAITGQISVTQIIGQDENDVGLLFPPGFAGWMNPTCS